MADAQLALGKGQQAESGQGRLHCLFLTLKEQNVAQPEVNVAQPAHESLTAPGHSQEVQSVFRMQPESASVPVLGQAAGSDDSLDYRHIRRVQRLADLRLRVSRTRQFKPGIDHKGGQFLGVGLDDKDIVGVYDLVAGRRAVHDAPMEESRDGDILFRELFDVPKAPADEP